jgi:hypothetical protein
MLLSKAKVADSGIPDAGLGLFTSEPLTQGTVVYRFDQNTDQLLTENDICELPPERQDYIRSHGRYSEEAKVWALDTDDAVYINHSEKPNLRGKGGPLGEFIAAVDLSAGTELTISYTEICDISRRTGLIDTSRTLGGERLQRLKR